MRLPTHKTKIVCTIGPASRSEAVPERLIMQGMNVARLNFAHGTLQGHREDIRRIRAVAAKLRRHCMIMDIMACSMAIDGSFFNTQSMVQEYVLNAYFIR